MGWRRSWAICATEGVEAGTIVGRDLDVGVEVEAVELSYFRRSPSTEALGPAHPSRP